MRGGDESATVSGTNSLLVVLQQMLESQTIIADCRHGSGGFDQ